MHLYETKKQTTKTLVKNKDVKIINYLIAHNEK